MHFQVPRHKGAYSDMLFVDGHVEPTGMKKLYTFNWHKDYPINRVNEMPDTFFPEWMRNLPD